MSDLSERSIHKLVRNLWANVITQEQINFKRETVPKLFSENRNHLKQLKRKNDEEIENIRARYAGTDDPYGTPFSTEVQFTNEREAPKYRFWLPMKSNFPEDADDNTFDRFVCYDSDDDEEIEAGKQQSLSMDAGAWANHGHIVSAVTLTKRAFDALDIAEDRVMAYYARFVGGDTFNEGEEILDQILAAVADQLADKNERDDCGIYRLMLAEWFLNHSKRILPPAEQSCSQSVTSGVYTYQELFCNRCFTYDCPLHGNESDERISRRIQNAKEPKILSKGDSCGPDCFRSDHSQRSQSKEPTDTELKLLEHARAIFDGTDFCSMAKFVKTMACFEIGHQITNCSGRDRLSLKRRREPLPSDSQQQDQWLKQTDFLKERERRGQTYTTGAAQNAYMPCYHPEGCCQTADKCSCAVMNRSCEKYCLCPDDCVRRFPGCDCIGECNPLKCWCRISNRECDPSICICAAKGKSGMDTNACQNVGMSRNLRKIVLVGVSEVCGYGAFLWESVKKGEYIGEYVGEIISTAEGERRDSVCKAEYLFRLTKDYDCDAFRKGNALRMANHSSQPNMECKVLEVNGDTRIGMFANQDISRYSELFFDYGEHYPKKGFKKDK